MRQYARRYTERMKAHLVILEEEAPVLFSLGTAEQLADMMSALVSFRGEFSEVILNKSHGIRAES